MCIRDRLKIGTRVRFLLALYVLNAFKNELTLTQTHALPQQLLQVTKIFSLRPLTFLSIKTNELTLGPNVHDLHMEEHLISVPPTITATCDRDTTALYHSPVLGHNVSGCDTVPLRSFFGEDYRVQAVGRLYPKSESSGFVTSQMPFPFNSPVN